MMYVNLVFFDHVATVLQSIIYIKKIPSILGRAKKIWKGTLFKRRAPGNVIASFVQRASIEFRQLLIISSLRK